MAEHAFESQQQDPPGHTGAMKPPPDHGEYTYCGAGKLTDKKVLITGGDSGIGRAVVLACAREGATYIAPGRTYFTLAGVPVRTG